MRARSLAWVAGSLALIACARPDASPLGPPSSGEDSGSTGGLLATSSDDGGSTSAPDVVDSSTGADPGAGSSDDGPEPMPPDDCVLPDGVPPSLEIQGHLTVPIDAISLEVALAFDASTATASGHAALQFRVGPEGGLPLFDLRQHVEAVVLDGAPLASGVTTIQPDGDPDTSMVVLNAELAPCSVHVLELDYDVAPSEFPSVPTYDAAGVVWFSAFIDIADGGYAELWMPANFPSDELAMQVDVSVVGTAALHEFDANGMVENRGRNAWRAIFPDTFTSMSPLMVVLPETMSERASEKLTLPDGNTVMLDVLALHDDTTSIDDIVAETAVGLATATLDLGEYPHGDRYFVFASHLFGGGMEYEGATASVPSVLHHEVFHSWIARGMRPLRHRDGWIDEAWTTYASDHGYDAAPISSVHAPVLLAPDDPWLRHTPFAVYDVGPHVLGAFAAAIGTDALRGCLRDFYVAHAGAFVTTEQFQAGLGECVGADVVDPAFSRFVYGEAQ